MRRRTTLAAAAAAFALTAGACAAAQGAGTFGWFKARPAPGTWKVATLPSGGAFLSYPPMLQKIRSDSASVSVARRDRSGRVLVYLNITPRQGKETLADWVAFRIAHDRGETDAVHLHGRATGLRFIGARGSCVLDDYRTRVKVNHYREIACFVQGRTSAAVIVAAALQTEWARSLPLLERAVEAFLVP